ncbi:PucR family transcriptional regulator [Gordonia neofelifaecis]|uniref:PucR family transcriptional regulator n=1 Tax=Gordonia neofelifaecis NRRL B-59395 TaxID=644548 RepID=F1YH71_9ACTN|nr:helix-turn-helix domain-containing protein [Gordonia neofelifaecis]EGD55986.1 hypothetical protein SCNU_07090 [Gordonia neofelifaecis NRRL B-59395]
MSDLVTQRAAAVGRKMREDLLGLSGGITDTLAGGIDQLDDDPVLVEMLGASVHGNVTNIVDMLAGDIPLSNLQPPTAAVEYALRLAQREIPSNALVRAYHMGQNYSLQVIYRIITEMNLPAQEALDLTAAVSESIYRYIDWITGYVFEAYENERRRWAGVNGTALTTTVHNLLASPESSADEFERDTAYRLDRVHQSAVLWIDDRSGVELAELDRIARRAAVASRSDGPPLVTPVDRSTVWVWVPYPGPRPRARSAESSSGLVFDRLPTGVRAAVGQRCSGAAGFRRSHEQALAALRVASVPGSPTGARIGYDDPGIAVSALLGQDVDTTAAWVREVLGDLASDSPATAPLRETLAVFLATADSHVRTAARLNLHRNTVKYRVDKALSMIGAERDRLDLAVSLTACELLGSLVLAAR